MKTVKDLSVKVTYRVGIANFKVPNEVFSQLQEIFESGREVDGVGFEYAEAVDWLTSHINESDCCDLYYEIQDLS